MEKAMQKYLDKAEVLIEALPYIQRFNRKVIVVKYGGSAMVDEELKARVIQDVTLLKLVGFKPIIVHGGGKEISKWVGKVGMEPHFINGLRVTDAETMELAEMVLGKVNKSLVQLVEQLGVRAIGISGKDGGLLKVDKKLADGEDIGFVGDVKEVNADIIYDLLEKDFLPIIAPIGLDDEYNTYNINADDAACAIAKAINAEKLAFLTDIEGVYKDPNDPSTLISELNVSEGKKLMEEGYGGKKSIPQMILAGASVDDVFVIVMFTAFTGLAQGDQVSAVDFINIPISIAVGALAGFLIGFLSAEYFKKIHIRDTSKVIILVCVSFLLVTFEDEFASVIPFASLIAVMTMGIALQQKRKNVAKRLSAKFNKLWVGAEVMLFVLVGATVDIRYAVSAGVVSIVLIFAVLVFRMLGVFLCLLKTKLTMKERMFCVIAYMPKATVQAAIGGVPLAMGLSCGNIVLTVAVTAILITAPLGAFLIEATYKKWLGRQTEILSR